MYYKGSSAIRDTFNAGKSYAASLFDREVAEDSYNRRHAW